MFHIPSLDRDTKQSHNALFSFLGVVQTRSLFGDVSGDREENSCFPPGMAVYASAERGNGRQIDTSSLSRFRFAPREVDFR